MEPSTWCLCVGLYASQKIGGTFSSICQLDDYVDSHLSSCVRFFPHAQSRTFVWNQMGFLTTWSLVCSCFSKLSSFWWHQPPKPLNFSALLKIVSNRRILARKIALQNKSPSFGPKQPVLLTAVAKTPPKFKLNKLWLKVFVLFFKNRYSIDKSSTRPKEGWSVRRKLR